MRKGDRVWSFTQEDEDGLRRLLERFREASRARSVLLVDRSGQLLASVGDGAGVDRAAFASLAAADFAASDQLAHLLGEGEFTSLWHQGEDEGMYLHGVGEGALLAVLFDGESTLGLLRLQSREIVPALVEFFQAAEARRDRAGMVLEAGWLSEAEDEIDRLFGE